MTSGHIGRYQLHKQIGRGGMARVFLATDPNFQREVAVKLIDGGLTTPELQNRFKNEAHVVANLEHFAIVPVYDFGLHNGSPFMVMRLMTGGTLEDRLHNGALSLEEIQEVLRRICAALDKAHDKKIVHRDLKPSNIMYDDQGVPYLADFGIARVIEGTQTQSVIGTPSYMSPEQARGSDLDPRTDVYQMGVILFEMLTGHRPFTGGSITELVMKHVREPVPPLDLYASGLPVHLENVVQHAMAKNPADRPPSAGTLYEMFLGNDFTPLAEINHSQTPQADLSTEKKIKNNRPLPRWLGVPGGVVALIVFGWLAVIFFGGPRTIEQSPSPPPLISPEVAVVVVTQIATSPPAPEVALVPTETAVPATQPPTLTPIPPTATATMLPFVVTEIGRSRNNQPLELFRFGRGDQALIFIGGLHAGFAPATVDIAHELIDELSKNPTQIPPNVSVYIVPNANPDSLPEPGDVVGRLNGGEVDLNRNWECDWVAEAEWTDQAVSGGSRPFSEPETRALVDIIEQIEPVGVVFWEAKATSGLVSPGGCHSVSQVSIPLAEAYATGSSFPLSDFENIASYDVNGDGTNWLDSSGVPAVAVLLRGYESYEWSRHWPAVQELLRFASRQ